MMRCLSPSTCDKICPNRGTKLAGKGARNDNPVGIKGKEAENDANTRPVEQYNQRSKYLCTGPNLRYLISNNAHRGTDLTTLAAGIHPGTRGCRPCDRFPAFSLTRTSRPKPGPVSLPSRPPL